MNDLSLDSTSPESRKLFGSWIVFNFQFPFRFLFKLTPHQGCPRLNPRNAEPSVIFFGFVCCVDTLFMFWSVWTKKNRIGCRTRKTPAGSGKSFNIFNSYFVAVLLGGKGKKKQKCLNFLILCSVSVAFSGKVEFRLYINQSDIIQPFALLKKIFELVHLICFLILFLSLWVKFILIHAFFSILVHLWVCEVYSFNCGINDMCQLCIYFRVEWYH